MPDPTIYEWPTTYTVTVVHESYPEWPSWSLAVEYRGNGAWAVKHGPFVISRHAAGTTGEPEKGIDRIPSERTDDHLAEYRMTLDEALALANDVAPRITVCGSTGGEYMARWDAAHQKESADA